MCHHNDSIASAVQLSQLFHDDMARAAIEVTRWLIRQDNRRVIHQGASNCHALHLPTTQLPRHVIFALLEVEILQHRTGLLQTLDAAHPPTITQGKGNVLQHR